MDAPERIWAWKKSENISPDHVRMTQNWIGGQIPEPNHDGTDFLAGYRRADLCADPALLAEAVEVLRMVDAWGHGLRHHTSHESKMVKSARAFIAKLENRHDR